MVLGVGMFSTAGWRLVVLTVAKVTGKVAAGADYLEGRTTATGLGDATWRTGSGSRRLDARSAILDATFSAPKGFSVA